MSNPTDYIYCERCINGIINNEGYCTNCKYNIINHEYEYEGKKCIKCNKKKELVCCKECHDDLCMTIKEAYD